MSRNKLYTNTLSQSKLRNAITKLYKFVLPLSIRRELWHYWYTGRGYSATHTFQYAPCDLFPAKPIPFPQKQDYQERVAIIIVTHNSLSYIKLTLQSILKVTEHPNYQIVIVDNGSTLDVTNYLAELYHCYPEYIIVIYNSDNRGFAAANNQGIVLATTAKLRATHIVLLNSDVIVTYGWLQSLLSALQDTKIGMVGPTTNHVGNEAFVTPTYRTLTELARFAARHHQRHLNEKITMNMLSMYCVALRSDVIISIGLLDEQFGMGYFEDDDYAERLHQAEYTLLCIRDIYIHHFGSATFSQLEKSRFQSLFTHNQHLFEKKWNVTWSPQHISPNYLQKWVQSILSKVM